jgi:hypothetical protein
MKDLKNRMALVTGGSRGIGAAVAIALARAGADVAVNYLERADAANAVCSEITGMGRKAIAVQADVSVAAEVKRMVAEVEAKVGGIDILVNNAAIAIPRKLEEITETEWDEVLTVNLKSVFLVTQSVVGVMRQRQWGRIIKPVFSRRPDGWSSGCALCRIQGGDHRIDALLRLSFRQGRDYGKRYRSCSDRDRYGNQQPKREPDSDSDGAFRFG